MRHRKEVVVNVVSAINIYFTNLTRRTLSEDDRVAFVELENMFEVICHLLPSDCKIHYCCDALLYLTLSEMCLVV